MLQIQKFQSEVKKGLPENIYFIYASESFFLFEAVRLIRKGFESITIEPYDSPENLKSTDLLITHSLFSEKRVLIVHNFEKIKKTDQRIQWLIWVKQNITYPITLVIMSNTSSKDIYDELEFIKKEKIVQFNLDINENDLEKWIAYKASEYGINLKSDTISYLIEITNAQPGLISSEIEKISLIKESANIGIMDVRDILSDIAEYKAFDLIEAIDRKDRKKAFRILEQIKTTDTDLVLGALNWYYSRKSNVDKEVFSLLYRANLSLRQGSSISLDLLLYELLKN